MAMADYLTVSQAAKELRLTPARVRQLANDGRLPCEKIGDQRFFHRQKVAKFSKIERKIGRPKKTSAA